MLLYRDMLFLQPMVLTTNPGTVDHRDASNALGGDACEHLHHSDMAAIVSGLRMRAPWRQKHKAPPRTVRAEAC